MRNLLLWALCVCVVSSWASFPELPRRHADHGVFVPWHSGRADERHRAHFLTAASPDMLRGSRILFTEILKLGAMRNVVTLVLGGGRGTRLYPLTKFRSKPAVPLAAKYRLIDIPLSNCINSGLNHVYVLTQFLSVSLHRHIRRTYTFDAFSGGFVELLAAQQTMDAAGADWYQGTADAVRKNLRYFDQPEIDFVVILSGDQLYRMDYRQMIKTHAESHADVTIASLPVSRQVAASFGIRRIEESGRVVGFLEKPKTDEEIDMIRTDPSWIDDRGIQSKGRECLASMGIYVFNKQFLGHSSVIPTVCKRCLI